MNPAVKQLAPPTEADPVLDDLLAEFGNQLHDADGMDMEAFISAHPERAEALRRMLPAIQALANLELSSGAADRSRFLARPGAQNGLGELGDYRLIREVGRGGMGVVYEAEQISLRRRVALKMLPFAAALDAKQLQRFKNEAQAAAGLHHTNIVPVHAVGCERGVHYYAMQFIEGHTLAALIAELKMAEQPRSSGPYPPRPVSECVAGVESSTPRSGASKTLPRPRDETPRAAAADTVEPVSAFSTERSTKTVAFFRTVATLGVQAAEALEHAHQLGVIHRDIKPANLLVDGRGNLWITDFGLAHCQNLVGLTMTGDLIGTLRYMSPEQALAKRIIIDQRTDIYSLGATLYELLTLEPAFPGRDRQELLRQIAFEEAPPPRRLNKAIPAELETIVLKAMEKNPAERYSTAQELADDLGRFLTDQPIRAKRPTLVQRARKWGRRHQPAVATAAVAAAVLVLLGVIGLIITNRAITQEQAQTKEANARLNTNLWRAMQTLSHVVGTVEEWWPHDPERKKDFHRMFEKVLEFYKEMAAQHGAEVRVSLAYQHLKLGNLLLTSGDRARAGEHYRQALDAQSKVVTDCPDVAAYQDRLAYAHFLLADLLTQTGETVEATEQYKRGFRLVEKLVSESARGVDASAAVALPYAGREAAAYYRCLAWNRATCLDPEFRDLARAVQVGQKAAQLEVKGVSAWTSVGVAHYRAEDWQAALAALGKATSSGGDSTAALFLAMTHWRLGHKEQARHWYDRAIQRVSPSGFPVRYERFRAEAADLLKIDRDAEAPDTNNPPAKQ